MTDEHRPRYEPSDALVAPRYTGVRTFARCPLVDDPADVDVAVLGIPFDTGTTNRPGARFGPEAIRSASIALRPYNAAQQTQVFGRLSVADLGDVAVTPGNAERTTTQIAVPVVESDGELDPEARGGVVQRTLGVRPVGLRFSRLRRRRGQPALRRSGPPTAIAAVTVARVLTRDVARVHDA